LAGQFFPADTNQQHILKQSSRSTCADLIADGWVLTQTKALVGQIFTVKNPIT